VRAVASWATPGASDLPGVPADGFCQAVPGVLLGFLRGPSAAGEVSPIRLEGDGVLGQIRGRLSGDEVDRGKD